MSRYLRRLSPLFSRGFSALILGLCALHSSTAHAGQFEVAPVLVSLSSASPSGVLTITNQSSETTRFHVSASAWNQADDGQLVLAPTTDIVFFPALLTLNPGEARKLRVGLNIKPGASEKSYRIFVQELPPVVKKDSPGAVRVLTKMGIPVFVQGPAPKAVPTVRALKLAGDEITFQVKNDGSMHFRSAKVLLEAKDAAGNALHSEALEGWYVLAGGTRSYRATLPKSACDKLAHLEVHLETDAGPASTKLDGVRCGE